MPNTSPCDHLERCLKHQRYGAHIDLNMPQRVRCFETVSRSGPNISPPNRKAAATDAESGADLVTAKLPANTGTASRKVTASCVFPDGMINLPDRRFSQVFE